MSLYFWVQLCIVNKAVTRVTVLCMPDVGMGVAHGAFFLEGYRVIVSLADGHRRFWTVTLLELWHILEHLHLIHQKI